MQLFRPRESVSKEHTPKVEKNQPNQISVIQEPWTRASVFLLCSFPDTSATVEVTNST